MKEDLLRSGLMLGERITFVLVNFFVFTILTRYLGPEDFGNLIYILAVFRISETIAQFGIDALFQKIIRRDYTLANYRAFFLIRCYSSAFAMVVFFCYAWLFSGGKSFFEFLLFLPAFFVKPLDFNEAFLLVNFKHKWVAVCRLIVTVLVGASQIVVVYFGSGYFAVIITYVFQFTLKPCLLYVVVRFLGLVEGLDVDRVGSQLKMSAVIPLALTAVVGIVFTRQDVILIQHYLAPGLLGVYAIGIRIQSVYMNFPTSVVSVLYPRMLAQEGLNDGFQRTVVLVGILLFFPAFLFALLISLFSDQVLFLLGGRDFVIYGYNLSPYIWALPLYSLTLIQSRLYLMRDCEMQNFVNATACLVFSFVAYICFSRFLGLAGIALGYLMTRILSIFVLPALFPKQRFFYGFLVQVLLPFKQVKYSILWLMRKVK